MIRVLFVCLGNICRSPMAEAVFRHMVAQQGLTDRISVDSAGLGSWHVGERPHKGTLSQLDEHRIPHDGIRARLVARSDFDVFDYIVAMDASNVKGLQDVANGRDAQVVRLMELVPDARDMDVPDPYYTDNFEDVYDMVEAGCGALLDKIKRDVGLYPS